MLKGRKIFITGGSSGIGLATARLAVAYGARVTVMGRSPEKLDAAKALLGDQLWTFSGDVTRSADVKAAVTYAVQSMDGLDGGVNSAGGSELGPIHALEDDVFDRVIKLCLYGTMYAVREASAHMVEHGIQGSIVNVSSLNSSVPYKMYTPYCAAKGGVDMLTKTAALDLAPFGIRVNAVCPGFTDTPLTGMFQNVPTIMEKIKNHTPLARWGTPAEIAESICFLLSDKASFITGAALVVDGGMQNTAYPDIFS